MPKRLHIRSRASRMRVAGLVQDTFEVRSMPIDELHHPVRHVQTFADRIASSIEAEGLANPVIVVRGPREDLVRQIQETGGTGGTLPDVPVVNCVYGGNNRVQAAKDLGYTHIDCVLLPTFNMGLRLQELQRNAYSYERRTATPIGE